MISLQHWKTSLLVLQQLGCPWKWASVKACVLHEYYSPKALPGFSLPGPSGCERMFLKRQIFLETAHIIYLDFRKQQKFGTGGYFTGINTWARLYKF